MKKYIKDLKSEREAIKMFLREQLKLHKTSINVANAIESAENAKIIELLQYQHQNLTEDNG